MVRHGDFSGVEHAHGWNEIVVDGRGNVYLNGADFDFLGGGEPKPGVIAVVGADGVARQVADDIEFPNGMVVTPDNSTLIIAESFARRLTAFDIAPDGSLSNRRVWAADVAADGICIDTEGAVWAQALDQGPDGTFTEAAVGSARAAKWWIGLISTGSASPACWADRTAARCSSCRPTGAASTRSTPCSPNAPGRC